MHYKVVVFGVKDTSENIVNFIQEEICPVDPVSYTHLTLPTRDQV